MNLFTWVVLDLRGVLFVLLSHRAQFLVLCTLASTLLVSY